MSLVGSLQAAIATFRPAQEAMFVDSASIDRPGAPVFNPTTGTYTSSTTSVYSGECLIRPALTSQQEEAQAQQTEITVTRLVGKFPADTAVELGDVVTVTASTYDAGLVGREMVVVDIHHDGWQICRRLLLEENRG